MLSTTKMKEEFEEETGAKVDDTETENKTYEVCTASVQHCTVVHNITVSIILFVLDGNYSSYNT